ncbi:MAG: hypothetical protein AAGA35_02440 [Patescibacteria group bacterium]
MFGSEIQQSKVLKWALGALIFQYFINFYWWATSTVGTLESVRQFTYVCPRFFQQCQELYFLDTLPYGYSQTTFYLFLLGLLAYIVYLMQQGRWQLATIVTVIPFVWHTLNVFILTGVRDGNYQYYVFIFGFTLLFLQHKEFFLKLFVVFFYFLSTVAKTHPGWIAGTYFSTLELGLPLVPDALIPVATNVVIMMEMVGAWFLLSRNLLYQRLALFFFIFFHLYSSILVGWHYPSIVLPMVLLLFGPLYRYTVPPIDRAAITGWLVAALLLCMQFIPVMIPGDEKLTLEGNKYGLYMFEANHQCQSEVVVTYHNDSTLILNNDSNNAPHRCDPYDYWFDITRQLCEGDSLVKTVQWRFDHSINGEPFLRIVDETNICEREYKPFSRNEWIKSHEDNPEVIGPAPKNVYY